jgi:hypothetical protein
MTSSTYGSPVEPSCERRYAFALPGAAVSVWSTSGIGSNGAVNVPVRTTDAVPGHRIEMRVPVQPVISITMSERILAFQSGCHRASR